MTIFNLETQIQIVSPNLQSALRWFHDRKGEEIPFPSPSPVSSLEHVVTAAKGIYKSAEEVNSLDVALSIRHIISSPYPSAEPVELPNGDWAYRYHHEHSDPNSNGEYERDQSYTNKSLMRNIETGAPVAVLVQTKESPGPLYRVMGLAVVTHWKDGFFYFRGFNNNNQADGNSRQSENIMLTSVSDRDTRERILREVVCRSGQGAFREGLLEAYTSRCAITGCNVQRVLDAAHIQPYKGPHTDIMSNGLLIRTDLHTLLDVGLLAVDPDRRTIILAAELEGSEYEVFFDQRIAEPVNLIDRPSDEALQAHFDWCDIGSSFRI